jgi:hypothetical protein
MTHGASGGLRLNWGSDDVDDASGMVVDADEGQRA